jgi:hypothetical protein
MAKFLTQPYMIYPDSCQNMQVRFDTFENKQL